MCKVLDPFDPLLGFWEQIVPTKFLHCNSEFFKVDPIILLTNSYSLIVIHWIEGYPVGSAIQLLNSLGQYSLDSFIDLLNNSDQVLTKHQVSVQWVLKLFLQNKPAPVDMYLFLASPSPLLGACLYTNMWHASDKGSCMSQKHAWC